MARLENQPRLSSLRYCLACRFFFLRLLKAVSCDACVRRFRALCVLRASGSEVPTSSWVCAFASQSFVQVSSRDEVFASMTLPGAGAVTDFVGPEKRKQRASVCAQSRSSNFYKLFSNSAENAALPGFFRDPLDTIASRNLIDLTKHSHRVTRLYGVQPVVAAVVNRRFSKKYPAVAAAGL